MCVKNKPALQAGHNVSPRLASPYPLVGGLLWKCLPLRGFWYRLEESGQALSILGPIIVVSGHSKCPKLPEPLRKVRRPYECQYEHQLHSRRPFDQDARLRDAGSQECIAGKHRELDPGGDAHV